MQGKFLVLGEKVEQFQTKSGPRQTSLVQILDMGSPRMVDTLDYELSDEEKPVHQGKLQDRTIEIGFVELKVAYGGRLRGKGRILKVGPANGN